MIDCHAHILPGVDDGPETIEEALDIARMAVADGITLMIATPHYMPYRFDQQRVRPAFEAFRSALDEADIPLQLALGNELELNEEGLKALADGHCLPMGGSAHVLVELPYQKMYPVHDQWLYELGIMGYTPVLAHVDRYPYLMADPERLKRMLSTGCVSQLNASALLKAGTRSAALKLIRSELVHLVASDCHSLINRPPALKEAYDIVADALGLSVAEDLFTGNGARLLEKKALVKTWGDMKAEKTGWRKWLGF